MDHFHAVALANQALDKVRRRVQNDTLGHRGRRDDPLYRIRRIALVAAERLDQRGWERLLAGLELGDPDGDVAAAWPAVQLFRKVYAAADKGAANAALNRFYQHCRDRQNPELDTLARPIRSWQYEILAYRPIIEWAHRSRQISSSKRCVASATDSGISTTIDSGSYCAAASHGIINQQTESEPDNHA